MQDKDFWLNQEGLLFNLVLAMHPAHDSFDHVGGIYVNDDATIACQSSLFVIPISNVQYPSFSASEEQP